MKVGITNLQVSGCIGGRLGHLVPVLTPFNSADTSIMIAWTAASKDDLATVLKYKINPREEINLKSLFSTLWDRTCWVQILAIEADGWDELRKHPHAPSAAPPPESHDTDDHFDDDKSMIPLEPRTNQDWPLGPGPGLTSGPDHDIESFPGPQNFRLSSNSAPGIFNIFHL